LIAQVAVRRDGGDRKACEGERGEHEADVAQRDVAVAPDKQIDDSAQRASLGDDRAAEAGPARTITPAMTSTAPTMCMASWALAGTMTWNWLASSASCHRSAPSPPSCDRSPSPSSDVCAASPPRRSFLLLRVAFGRADTVRPRQGRRVMSRDLHARIGKHPGDSNESRGRGVVATATWPCRGNGVWT
jgi:hypothetical protein